jgi:hypothetical protein
MVDTNPFNEVAFEVPSNHVEQAMQREGGHHEVTQPNMIFGCMLKWDVYGTEKNRSARHWKKEQI